MLATCDEYRAHRHGSESPHPGSTPFTQPARSSPRPPPSSPRRPSLSTSASSSPPSLPPSQLPACSRMQPPRGAAPPTSPLRRCPRPSPPPTAAHISATPLSCLARRHCTPLPPRAPLNRFARSSSCSRFTSRWRSVHAGFARSTVSTPSYSPSPRPLGLPPRLSRRTPRAPLAPCATHRASPIAKFHLLSGAPLAGLLPVVM